MKIQVTPNAQLSSDHYRAHDREDFSKQSSELFFYNLYAVDVNLKNQYELENSIYEKIANNPNIASVKKGRCICGSNPNAMCCAQGTTMHKLNFRLDKNQDIFIYTYVNLKHCDNAEGFVLTAHPYWTINFVVDYMEY